MLLGYFHKIISLQTYFNLKIWWSYQHDVPFSKKLRPGGNSHEHFTIFIFVFTTKIISFIHDIMESLRVLKFLEDSKWFYFAWYLSKMLFSLEYKPTSIVFLDYILVSSSQQFLLNSSSSSAWRPNDMLDSLVLRDHQAWSDFYLAAT